MKCARFRILRLLCYTFVGVLLASVAWSMTADSIYAKLRMKMSQSAPYVATDVTDCEMEATYLKEAQNSGVVLPSYGEKYGILICDEIGLNAPLYYGDDEEILLKGVGQYPTMKIPGMGGSFLIGGHDTTYFGCLADVEIDDRIHLSMYDITYTYKVVGTKVIDSNQFVLEEVSDQEECLILYTCYPLGKTENNRNMRLFVYCQME